MELAAKQNNVTTVPKKSNSFFQKKTEPPFFSPVFIQPKLTVGPVDDPYEREADAVAEKVMRMPDQASPLSFFTGDQEISRIQRQCTACTAEEKLPRMEDDEEELVQSKRDKGFDIQRMCSSCEEEEDKMIQSKSLIQRKCAECEEEEQSMIQPKRESAIQLSSGPSQLQRKCEECEEEEQGIARKESGNPGSPPVTQSVKQTLDSPGHRMDKTTRSFMESRFGHDFGNVRIHNDQLANRSSKDIRALAYTHGDHVVFGEGQYQPHTNAGRQLLAHELTHVVQQGNKADAGKIQRAPYKNVYNSYTAVFANPPTIDIRGKEKLQLDASLSDYFASFFQNDLAAPIKLTYGSLAAGYINIFPQMTNVERKCDTGVVVLVTTHPVVPILPIPVEHCDFYFNAAKSTYNALPQTIGLQLPNLDTKKKPGSFALKIKIENSVITGKVGWVDGTPTNMITPEDYDRANDELEAFLPFILGKDYTGDNFELYSNFYNNSLSSAGIILNCWGGLSLPNKQSMTIAFQAGDREFWQAVINPEILGAEYYNLKIDRTPDAILTGEGDGLKIRADWGDKKFDTTTASLQASYVNSKLNVVGEANYKSERAEGKLFLAVTDYATAKKYAIEYLPDDIAKLATEDKTNEGTEGLAFVGAGKLKFTLFDGQKKPAPKRIPTKDTTIEKKDKTEHTDKSVVVDASFVVEPDGYITVAGQIKQPQAVYTLFDEMKYSKVLTLLSIPVLYIPLPIPGTHFDFDIAIKLEFGAGVGPLTLSQLKVWGLYSNRPGATKELELSGVLNLKGNVFADLILELSASVGAGPFTIEVLSKKITFGAKMEGSVTATPTIGIRKSDESSEKPREYYFKGNFDFDAAGKLSYQMTDRFKANAEEVTKDKAKTPDQYKYINSTQKNEKKIGGRDVEVPLDHSLGTEEPPDFVSVEKLANINLKSTLTNLIKGRKTPFFEKGASTPTGDDTVTSAPGGFDTGDYMEGGHIRGRLGGITKSATDRKNLPTYVFSKEFLMKGVKHTLFLIADVEQENGVTKSIRQILMMASDQMEELPQKIQEEKTEIQKVPEPTDRFQEKDLQVIEKKQEDIKNEVQDLALHGQLTENTEIPELVELAVPLERYAERYERNDLGTDQPQPTPKPSTPLTPTTPTLPSAPTKVTPDQPAPDPAAPVTSPSGPTPTGKNPCPKPTDIFPGNKLIFDDYYGDDSMVEVDGFVIAVEEYPDKAGNMEWHIRFKPTTARETTSWAPRAYKKGGCLPAYRRPFTLDECKTTYIRVKTINVPQRTIGARMY